MKLEPLGLPEYKGAGESYKDKEGIVVIAGPCSAESEGQVMATARALSEEGIRIYRAGLWKPRTKPGCFEGVGGRGLDWLLKARRSTGMSVATEVATAAHVRMVAQAELDLIWIGARTSANPFAVQEIADTLREVGWVKPVLVKNPVNPDIELWIGALERLNAAGIRKLGAVHRGFSSSGEQIYRNSPQWGIPSELRRRFPSLPIFCDPSHIGGKRVLVPSLSQFALDLGFEGLMIESHIDPEEALSDSEQQLTPKDLGKLVASLTIRAGKGEESELAILRSEVDEADGELLAALARRMDTCRRIGEYKKKAGMTVLQTGRLDYLIKSRMEAGDRLGMDERFIKRLFTLIHEESVREQLNLYNQPSSED